MSLFDKKIVQEQRRSLLTLLLAALLLTMSAACGSPTIHCAANESLVDGKCQVISCATDANACPTGTYCDTNKTCVIHPDVTCTDSSGCGNGSCVAGKCVNPKWCHFNRECIPGDACDTTVGQCRPSVCPDACHNGGACNEATQKCESLPSCTKATESIACIKDEKCVLFPGKNEGICVSGNDYCNSNPCVRGQCDPTDFLCKDAPTDCYHNDKNCVAGKYCDGSVCKPSKCAAEKTGCTGDRGICNPASGFCENKNACVADSECLSGYKCVFSLPQSVKGRTGTCVLESDKEHYCQPACTGRQTCEEADDAWTCKEPDICQDARDCFQNRVCKLNMISGVSKCVGPLLCDTPHKGSLAQPVPFNAPIKNVTLCSGADYYTYQAPATVAGNNVVVKLEIDGHDIGVGDVILTATSSDPAVPAVTKTLSKDGQAGASLLMPLPITPSSSYLLKVELAPGVTQPVHYSLSTKVIDPQVASACFAAKELPLGTVTDALFDVNQTTILKDCNDPDGTIREDVWHINLPKEQSLSVTILPSPDFNPMLSLRRDCDESAQTLECLDLNGDGQLEHFTKTLPAGDYYITVQSNNIGKHNYSILAAANNVACVLGDRSCSTNGSVSSATYCPYAQDKVESIQCAKGCSQEGAGGYCKELEGSSCLFAFQVDPMHYFFKKALEFPKSSKLQLSSTCGNVKPSDTTLGERVFAVNVPHGYSIEGSIQNTAAGYSYNYYSYYILDACEDSTTSCIYGQKYSRLGYVSFFKENISWFNKGPDRTVYVVVDARANQFGNSDPSPQAAVYLHVVKHNCIPDAFSCDGNILKLCDSKGSVNQTYVSCSTTCDDSGKVAHCASLAKGDTCDAPIELTEGTQSTPYNVREATDDYDFPQLCGTVSSSDPKGLQDYVFKATAANIGDVITFTATPTSKVDLAVWSTDACTKDFGKHCAAGSDVAGTGGAEKVSVKAIKPNQDFYFFVQGEGEGTFTTQLDIDKKEPKCLDTKGDVIPGKVIPCDDHNNLYLCTDTGHYYRYPCATCQKDATKCDVPVGGFCDDAFDLDLSSNTGTITGDMYNLPTKFNYFGRPQKDDAGSCFFDRTKDYNAFDTVYRIKLPPHKRFSATLDLTGSKYRPDMQIYFEKTCGDSDSCVGSQQPGNQTISYVTGDLAETLYLVLDAVKPQEIVTPFSIQWSLTDDGLSHSILCQPGEFYCDRSDDKKSSYCDETGSALPFECDKDFVCHSGACSPKDDTITVGRTCDDALEVKFPVGLSHKLYKWDTASLTTGIKSDCVQIDDKLRYFKVLLNEGDTLKVKAGSIDGTPVSVLLVDDCALQSFTCDANVRGYQKQPKATLTYTASKKGYYYVAIARTAAGDPSDLYAEFSLGRCASDKPTCGALNGKTYVSYCSKNEKYSYLCQNGCDTDNTCLPAQGNSCFDAVLLSGDQGTKDATLSSSDFNDQSNLPYYYKLNSGDSYLGTFSYRTDVSGACLFNRYPGYMDQYYAVPLKAGDHLHVDLTNLKDVDYFSLYMIGDCVNQECLLNDSRSSHEYPRSLDFIAPESKTYYIVVALGNAYFSANPKKATYTLGWNITKNTSSDPEGSLAASSTSCTPFTSQCFQKGSKVELHTCSDNGKSVDVTTCPAGTSCFSGSCAIDQEDKEHTIDSCDDETKLVQIRSTQRVDIAYNKLRNSHLTTLNCVRNDGISADEKIQDTVGPDAFFKVTIPKGENLRIWAKVSESADTMFFATYDSCDLSAQCSSGGAHSFTTAGVYEKIVTYEGDSTKEKSFILVLDGVLKELYLSRTIFFDFYKNECDTIGDAVCDSSHPEIIKQCASGHLYSEYTCSSHQCETTSNGAQCKTPSGDNCREPYVIPNTKSGYDSSTTYANSSFANHTNDLHVDIDSAMCTGSDTYGNDVVYQIKLWKGQTLTATLKGKNTAGGIENDLAIYLTKNCTDSYVPACLAASDQNGVGADVNMSKPDPQAETLTYTANEDEPLFLVVDSYWRKLASDFDLHVKVN